MENLIDITEEVVIAIDPDAVAKCPECKGLFHEPHHVGFIKKMDHCQFCAAEDVGFFDNKDLNSCFLGKET